MLEKRHSLKDKGVFDMIIYDKVIKKLKGFNNIASYYSFNGEVDTYKINEWILNCNKNLYLPKIIDDEVKFIEVKDLKDVIAGKFNVLEPLSNKSVNFNEIDCMIIPLLAFNKALYRLGYGKGYYDRVLKKYRGYRLGLAYSCLETDNLTVEKHDERLDKIIVG